MAYVYVSDGAPEEAAVCADGAAGQRWQDGFGAHSAGPLCGSGPASGAGRVRYTAAQLRSALLLTGCKPRVAHKARARQARQLPARSRAPP